MEAAFLPLRAFHLQAVRSVVPQLELEPELQVQLDIQETELDLAAFARAAFADGQLVLVAEVLAALAAVASEQALIVAFEVEPTEAAEPADLGQNP